MPSPLDLIFGDDFGTAVLPPVEPPVVAAAGIDLLDLVTLTTPYVAGEGGGTGGGPEAGSFLEAVRTLLLSAPLLAEITDVYLGTAGPMEAFPFLLMTPIDAGAAISSSESYYEVLDMQYDVLTLDADTCLALGRAAREVLLPRAGDPPLAFAGGYEMGRWPTRARGPYPEAQGMPGGETVWRLRFEYSHMIGRD